jgi:hypothetical protein
MALDGWEWVVLTFLRRTHVEIYAYCDLTFYLAESSAASSRSAYAFSTAAVRAT